MTLSWIDLTWPPARVAQALIGARLSVNGVGGTIVETEAYDIDDEASHSFIGQTARNATMFGPPGRAYVYRIFGLHWCLNVVCGPHPGAAVLIRALEPSLGLQTMIERRGSAPIARLCAGPGNLCQALGIDRALDGAPLWEPPFQLDAGESRPIVTGPRIGISRAVDKPWRFGAGDSKSLSRPFARRRASQPAVP